MNIPFFRFDAMHAPIREELLDAATRVIDSGWYVLGDEVREFEDAFAAFCGTRYAIGVGNGLDALHLALRAMGIGSGDEVIVPSNTYIATVLAVSFTGATPVLVEPRPGTANMDPAGILDALTSRTRAVIPVHLYGQACEMPAILDVTTPRGLWVIEDNAQSQGASIGGRMTGSWGHLNATSFYPGKNIGALGDGGAVTTSDPDLAERLRKWRNYGSGVKYLNEFKGFNSRLDELQAAFLRIKLTRLQEWNRERVRLASIYLEALRDVGDLSLPETAEGCSHVYHLFVIRTTRRDELQAWLRDRGIATLIHYPVPPHLQEAYRGQGWRAGQFPIAEDHARSVLSLPLFPGLTADEQGRVIESVKAFYGC